MNFTDSRPATLRYYDETAERYFQSTRDVDMSHMHRTLLSQLAPHSHILDAGCGSGRDSKAFLAAGHRVTAFDGCAPLAALASRHIGQPVLVRDFADIDFVSQFDAVYASASLLHLDDAGLEDALKRLFVALKPSGLLVALFKLGDTLRVDESTGRVFNDMTVERITPFIERANGVLVDSRIDLDKMGRGNNWLVVLARPRR